MLENKLRNKLENKLSNMLEKAYLTKSVLLLYKLHLFWN